MELRPEDPVLNDHLGDAYWRVGREREARFQWDQALTLEARAGRHREDQEEARQGPAYRHPGAQRQAHQGSAEAAREGQEEQRCDAAELSAVQQLARLPRLRSQTAARGASDRLARAGRDVYPRDRPRQDQPDIARARPSPRRLSRDGEPGGLRRRRRRGDAHAAAPLPASGSAGRSPATSPARTWWRGRWTFCSRPRCGPARSARRAEKNLPVAAGLGGGSADAAALLRAVRQANPDRADAVAWHEVAARLGADVPVCLAGVPAVMWGIGEMVEPLRDRLRCRLCRPCSSIRAGRWRRPRSSRPGGGTLGRRRAGTPLAVSVPLDAGGLARPDAQRGNDLERPATALLPVIADIKAAFSSQAGCLVAAMSGSGPTCFGMFADTAAAARATATLAHYDPRWWVVETRLDCPAPGGQRKIIRGRLWPDRSKCRSRHLG